MQLRIFTEPQMGATYDDLLAVARRTEETGFDAFFRSDHYLTMGGDGLPGPTDAWVTLAGLARETSRIRLGTLVTAATFRLPGPLAIAVAQVDQMSGGRVELGLGAGWFDDEHTAYGIPFPPVEERFDRYEEQLAIVTGLWATPVGRDVRLRRARTTGCTDSPALPKPVQDGGIPVIVGGKGKRRTPRLAARYAARVQRAVRRSAEANARLFAGVREACEEAGRDPASLVLQLGADRLRRPGRRRGRPPGRRRSAGTSTTCGATGVAGTPAEVVDKLGRYAEAGAQRRLPAGARPRRPRPPRPDRERGGAPAALSRRDPAQRAASVLRDEGTALGGQPVEEVASTGIGRAIA